MEQDQKLLVSIKDHLPQLNKLLAEMIGVYEDKVYRFYHQSFKNLRAAKSDATNREGASGCFAGAPATSTAPTFPSPP